MDFGKGAKYYHPLSAARNHRLPESGRTAGAWLNLLLPQLALQYFCDFCSLQPKEEPKEEPKETAEEKAEREEKEKIKAEAKKV